MNRTEELKKLTQRYKGNWEEINFFKAELKGRKDMKKEIEEWLNSKLNISEGLRKELYPQVSPHVTTLNYKEWNNELDGLEYHIRELKELKQKLKEM